MAALIALVVLLWPGAGRAIDRTAQVAGAVLILLMLAAVVQLWPQLSWGRFPELGSLVFPLVTIVGGTVGGYIPFSGAHRMLDLGFAGPDQLGTVRSAAVMGILAGALVRVLLFLAAWAVVAGGTSLGDQNPAAAVFAVPFGLAGLRIFGLALFLAALTSVIGSAYTSVSFLTDLGPAWAKKSPWLVVGFIAISLAVFLALGQPAKLLIVVGALNALVLPFGLLVVLWAARRPDLLGGYRHPVWLWLLGLMALLLASLGGYFSFSGLASLWAE